MKEKPFKHKTGALRESKSGITMEVLTICPKCGGEVALWSEGSETLCIFCRYRVFDRETTIH